MLPRLILFACAVSLPAAALAQSWPAKPIRLILGYTTGGAAAAPDGYTLHLVDAGPMTIVPPARVGAIPEVPTVAAFGFPGFEALVWFAIVGPARLPAEIVAKASGALGKALDDKGVQEAIRAPSGARWCARRISRASRTEAYSITSLRA